MLFDHKSKKKLRLDAILEKKKREYFKSGGKIELIANGLKRPYLKVNEFDGQWRDKL